MGIYTYEEAKSRLDEALDARSEVLKSQSYSASGRALQRAQLEDINKDISKWEKIASRLSSGSSAGIRSASVVPDV